MKQVYKGCILLCVCLGQMYANQSQLVRVAPKNARNHFTSDTILEHQDSFQLIFEQPAERDVTIKFAGADEQTNVVFSHAFQRLLNPHNTLMQTADESGTITLPATYGPCIHVFQDTFECKDDRELLRQRLATLPLTKIIAAYNFCNTHALSPHYCTAVIDALLYDHRFLDQLMKHQTGNILCDHDEQQLMHCTKRYLQPLLGDPLYREDQKMVMGLVNGDVFVSNDFTRIAALAGNTIKIYSCFDGKQYQELQTITLPEQAFEMQWAQQGAGRFIVMLPTTILLYEYVGGGYQKIRVIEMSTEDEELLWQGDFDQYIKYTASKFEIFEYKDEGGYSSRATYPVSIRHIFADGNLQHLALWESDKNVLRMHEKFGQKYIYTGSHSFYKDEIPSIYPSPDAQGFCVSSSCPDHCRSYMIGCNGVCHTLSEQLPMGIDHVVWGKNKQHIGLLLGKALIYLFSCHADGTYHKLTEIVSQEQHYHSSHRWIRSFFANEDFSKIILWWGNPHRLTVYQQVVTEDQKPFQLTQEIELPYKVRRVSVNTTLETIMVHDEHNELSFYRLEDPVHAVNQTLILSALHCCLQSAPGRVWLRHNKAAVKQLLGTYAQHYGHWITQRWIQKGCTHKMWDFLTMHKAKLGSALLLGVASFFCAAYYSHTV